MVPGAQVIQWFSHSMVLVAHKWFSYPQKIVCMYINLFCSVILSISIHLICTQSINNQQPTRMQFLSVVCKTSTWRTVSLLFNTNFTMSKYNLRILYHSYSLSHILVCFFLPIRQYCRSDFYMHLCHGIGLHPLCGQARCSSNTELGCNEIHFVIACLCQR